MKNVKVAIGAHLQVSPNCSLSILLQLSKLPEYDQGHIFYALDNLIKVAKRKIL